MDHLADAPIANILILAGVVFLAVGIFGRVGGFIGSIFGNIEAGKNSRVLAGVLGVLLIVGGGWLHEESDKTTAKGPSPTTTSSTAPASSVPTSTTTPWRTSGVTVSPAVTPAAEINHLSTSEFDDGLLGTWDNLTPRANSLKRLEISRSEKGLNVHAWYSCPSGDCDVGPFPVKMSQGMPMYDYADDRRHRITSLNLFRPQVLLVSVEISQRDSSRWRNNWVFAKSTMSDKMRGNFSHYLDSPSPKAFAATPHAGPWAFAGGSSTEGAKEAALRDCEKFGVQGCKVILVNDTPAE